MTETETGQAAPASQNGAAPMPEVTPEPGPNMGERLMFAVMLAAGAGLLFLAIDGLSGYALSRLLTGRGEDDDGG